MSCTLARRRRHRKVFLNPGLPQRSLASGGPGGPDLKRNLLELRNAALPLAEISSELMRLHEDPIPKELRACFRNVQDHVARLVGLIDAMRDMLTTAMQVNLALGANNQNEVVKRLAGWGAILAIPTVIFSPNGMN